MNRAFYVAMVSMAIAGCNTLSSHGPKVVQAGKTLKIGYYGATNPDCSMLDYPVVRITAQPAHGKTDLRRGVDYPTFPASNPRSACNGKPTPSIQVMYTPDPGYLGADLVAVQVIFPDGREDNVRIPIVVR